MQLTRKQLKEIISEEVEKISEQEVELESLMEGYVSDYGADDETISKEAMIDFLEVMEESKISRQAFEAFMEHLPEEVVTSILKEVVTKDEE